MNINAYNCSFRLPIWFWLREINLGDEMKFQEKYFSTGFAVLFWFIRSQASVSHRFLRPVLSV